MRAVRLLSWQAEPELCDVEVPVPGPGEVLVKVEATGLCHSDLHVMDWPPGTLGWDVPVTLGHETAGTVAALGPGARGVQEGEPVLVYGPWGCGVCRQCACGAENLCPKRTACGLGSGEVGVLPSSSSSRPPGCWCPVEISMPLGPRR